MNEELDPSPITTPESASTVAEPPPALVPAPPHVAETAAARGRGIGTLLWREWVRPFILILIVMGTFRSAVADWNHVPTGSMKPTILVGDRIFVNKLAYDLKIPFTRVRL